MARTSREMADKLIEVYRENGKRYRLSQDAFKRIAGKTQLREAFLSEVNSFLREDGYALVSLREEQGCVVVVKQGHLMKYDDLSDAIQRHVFVEQEEEWDEE